MENLYELFLSSGGFSSEQMKTILSARQEFLKEDEAQPFLHELSSTLFDKTVPIGQFCRLCATRGEQSPMQTELFFLLFFWENIPKLHADYQAAGLDEEMFFDLLKDFKSKVDTCYDLRGYLGVTSVDWYGSFFRLQRFPLGRFHYNLEEFSFDEYSHAGVTLRRGDKLVCVHIPAGGKISAELRLASYKKAYAFYKEQGIYQNGIMPVICHSWIFYQPYKALFSPTSNLYGFADEFHVLHNAPQATFKDGWRIFGRAFNDEFKNLPQETSLQKAFVEYARTKQPFGIGFALLLFDGEKIIK